MEYRMIEALKKERKILFAFIIIAVGLAFTNGLELLSGDWYEVIDIVGWITIAIGSWISARNKGEQISIYEQR